MQDLHFGSREFAAMVDSLRFRRKVRLPRPPCLQEMVHDSRTVKVSANLRAVCHVTIGASVNPGSIAVNVRIRNVDDCTAARIDRLSSVHSAAFSSAIDLVIQRQYSHEQSAFSADCCGVVRYLY